MMSERNYLVDIYHTFDSGGSLHWKGVIKRVLGCINWYSIQVRSCDPLMSLYYYRE